MSCHKHNFQCFSAVGGDGSLQHRTNHLPRILHHGLFEGCCLCSEYQHAQALEAAETRLLPFYHPSSPQYALRDLSGPEEARSRDECHRHRHRLNKRVVLVKNSDPSCRRTVVLRRRGLHSFALFLEEVSELMRYHTRRLYTQDGCKIDSVQSLLQCPGVLICVGREPTHPSVTESFRKTSSDNKLPKLSVRSRSTGRTDGNERLTTKTSAIPPNPESYSGAAKQSVSSEKSGPDGADSPSAVGSGPPAGDSMREDDIEKLVRVNKDGSLTMEMKVRFRLQNDQTLQWSTKVRKSRSGTSDHIQGHDNPHLAQVCDVSCSEWENISADDACFTQHCQGHAEEAHCARCCSRGQDEDNGKSAPRTHAARRCVLTSSSSASSLTVVSRKTVVERQTVSRSSEEVTEGVVEREACVTQSTQAAETVAFCTIQSETCSSKSERNKSYMAGLHGCTDNERDVNTAQGSEHVQAVSCTSGTLAGDEENQNEDGKDVASRTSSHMSRPETKVTTGGKMLDTASPDPHVSIDKTSNQAGRSRKMKTSKPSHACHCGASASPQDETKGQIESRAEGEGELERAQSSSMSVKSHTSYKEGKMGSKSAIVQSNASTKRNSDGLEDAAEQIQTGDDDETQARPSSCVSVTPVKSGEEVEVKRPLSSVSTKSKASARSKRSQRSCAASEKQAEEDSEQRTPSVMSALSNVSAELKHLACEASEEESSQHSDDAEENEDEPDVRVQSAKSDQLNGSRKSRSCEVRVTDSADISDKVSNKGEGEQRSWSVKSNVSAKSNKSKNTAVLHSGSGDDTTHGNTGEQSEEKDLSYKHEVEEASDMSNMCNGDDQQETTGRASCTSNGSVRSSQSNRGDKSDKEDVSDEGRGPSVMSVKSAKSTFSNTSAKSNPSKPNDVPAAGHADHRERAPSNMSAASVKSSRSDTSAARAPTDVWDDASEETVAEGGRKSVSSVSVLSDKSNISSRSKHSAPSPAADGTEILCGENEKVKREKRAAESHSERASSALSAKSTSSRKSTKSTKSNPANVHLSMNPGEHKDEDENQERAQSAMSAKTIESTNSARSARSKCSADALQEKNSEAPDGQDDPEQSEERPPSSTSVKTIHSQVSADRPETASSGKSAKSRASAQSNVANVQTPAAAEILDGADETAFTKSTKSKTCGPADKNRSNHEERVERAQSNMSGRSEKSAKSNVSRASKRAEVAAVCLEEELHNTNQRAAEGERDENSFRPTSPQSDDSDMSVRTNKSNCTTDALLEEDSKTTDEENDEEREERPPSSVSAKSIQSSVSEISIKSAERTQSALSTKSAKSSASATSAQTNISEVCSGRSPAGGNDAEETHERALSAKTTKSTNSVKSTKTKKLDDPAENNATGQNDDVERARSSSSVRSGKSTVSNVSSVSKRKGAAGACWEDEVEKETAEEQGEEERTSPQSVVSNRSGKSNKSTSSADAPVKERPDVPIEDTERAERSVSTTSSRSCVSETSVKSAKSNASALSVKTNISDARSGKPSAPPDEADSEDEEGTHSVVSVKSTNSMISDKSVQSAGPNNKNHTDRAPSNPSAERETSPESSVSTASEGSHISKVQDSFNSSDTRAAEGETNARGTSLASPQSDRLQSPAKESSEITDDGNNTEQSENRTLSSMSAKSVQSCVSGRSAKSARSAKSTKSAKSVQTDVSVPPGATSQNPEQDDENETLQRTHSALSAKTTKSTHSTASTKLKAKGDISGDEGHEDKSSSNMSTRSARSSKSTVSTLSQKSKASGVPCEPNAERVHEENPQEDEEDIESGSMSSMSIHSAKTDVSSRSNRSKCSIHVAAEENTRPKSSSTQVLSASNTPEGEHDEQSSRGRSESVVSAKSRSSAKSNRSKVSAAPAAESPLELDCEERPESDETIKSNVSARPGAASARCSESPNEDCGEETAEGRSASCTSVKTSLSHASERSLKSHASATESAPSTSSAKSVKSTYSEKSMKSPGPKVTDVPDEAERAASAVSDRSANLTQSQAPTRTASCEEGAEGESSDSVTSQRGPTETQRTQSVLSFRSNTSASTIQSNTCTPNETIKSKEPDEHCVTSTKAIELKDHETLAEESTSHSSDKYTEEKPERTPSVMSVKTNVSVKSKKSNVFDGQVKESATYKEERTDSPVSVKSNLSDVPAVTVEESEDRSPTAISTKSKTRSKKSKTPEVQGKKSDEKSQSSLSVRSHLSVKSKKSTRTDISTASISSKDARQRVSGAISPSLQKKDKEDTTDKDSFSTVKSRGEGTEETRAEVTVENSTASQSAQRTKAGTRPVICHAESSESDLSQTLSTSDNIKEICETSTPEELVSKRIAKDQLEAKDKEGSDTNKSDKSCTFGQKHKDPDDFGLVTSILPSSSPTEVVNEWLKRLPEEGDIYNLEELNEDCDEPKSHAVVEESQRAVDSDKTVESEAEISKTNDEENTMNAQRNECQTSTDAKQEDNSCTQRDSGSKMINPSIQVMKVLLNPKLDRCNSLPEISPVYGRKLSASAKGLLDCFVKLQLIDHKSKIANEKDKRYQELMRILQSLWLADPPASEGAQNKNEHRSVDEEYNHTSSSGVDVNSGSTGSGKSSDGVKSSNDFNGLKVQEEAKDQWQSERVDAKQEDEDPGTDETIRNNDSPREPPETPSPSNKTSGDSSSNGQKLGEEAETESQEDSSRSPTLSQKAQLDKMQSQDLDPVWVLTLLTKIEKQFMTHYMSAMQEFKVRLNLDDGDQLDVMIAELKTEIQQRIQTSIDREVKRLQSRAGLPRPPKEASPRVSTLKSEERRQRRKIKLQQSMDSQAERSDDSASGTAYSDQRNENIDECCPCETCLKEEMTSSLALAAIVRSTAPVIMDSDLKAVMQMKTGGSVNAQTPVSCVSQSENSYKTTAGEITSDEDAALEEDTCVVAITSDGEFKIGSEVDQDMSNKEDKNEETTVTAPSEHTTDKKEHVTVGQRDQTEKTLSDELSNRTNQVDDYETDELMNVEVPCKNELKEEEMETSVEEASVTKQDDDIEKTRKKWWTVKKTLLPTLRIALGRKDKSMYSEENDTGVLNENVKEAVDRSESTRGTAAVGQTKTSSDDESGKETTEGTTDEDGDGAEEVDVATTLECKSNKEENEETNTDDDVSSEEEILETASNAEDEKAIETSTIVTGEHVTEEDDAVERTTVTALSDQESDTDTAGEKTGTTSEDEPEDDVTSHKLSSELVEGSTEDESVVEETAATRKDKAETTPVEVKNVEGSFMRSKREHTSEKETSVEDSVASEEEATPTSGKESPDENGDSATDDSSEKPDEMATATKKAAENQNADSGDEESMNETAKEEDASVVSSTAHESDDEEAVEVENADAGEENGAGEKTYAAEPLTYSSEDEIEAPETSVEAESDRESVKDASESDGAVPDVEKLPDTENADSASADGSSEESSEEGATNDDEAGLDGSAVSRKDESKDESTEGETSEETEKEAAAEAATDDDDDEEEETSAASEEEEKDASTNEDESAENDDVVNGELSNEQAEEEDTEDEQNVEETTTDEDEDEDEDVTTMTVTSPHISEKDNAAGEELINFEDKPAIAKKPDLDVISETDNEEEGTGAGTTECGSGKGPGEDVADEDSGEDLDAFPTETSSTEKKEQIEKAYDEWNENEQEDRTDGEKQDVCDNTETDPGSAREESRKAASGTESDEERDRSGTDGDKSENSPDELAGQDEAPSVKSNDSGEDSEAQPEPGTGEDAAQAATDENETLSEDEHVEGAEELDEKESRDENAKDFQEEEQSDTFKNEGPAEDETPGDESEDESGRESEPKCDARQNETEESKHPDAEEDEVTKSDEEEDLRAEDGSKGEEAEREESDKADDETAQAARLGADRDVAAGSESESNSDKIKHLREDDDTSDERQENKRSSLDNDQETAEESEKEGEERETLTEDWSGYQGASADGGDEAEEDSDQPEEVETDDGAQPFVINKADVSAASNQETTLMPLDPLDKQRDESEDGAYADVEDSETEMNSQEEEMSLTSTSLKHRLL